MRAMVIRQFGGPEVFEQVDLPTPVAGPGQVLIRVAGSSVNPVDYKIRSGALAVICPDFPAILHGDVSGTIEAVGDGVTQFQPGDQVYACAGGFKQLPGALAEFMVADADLVARKPHELGLVEAAALPLVGITAWEAVVDRAGVQPGQRVLVHAGTGGVGHAALQLAKDAGAIVTTTVSTPAKAQLAAQLGADTVVNRKEMSVADYVSKCTQGAGFDVVIDTVGGHRLDESLEALGLGGTLVSIASRSTHDLTPLHAKGATLHVVFMLLPLVTGKGRAHHGDILTRLARLVDAGRFRPLLDPEPFSFAHVGDAHARLESGAAIGKIRLRAEW